MKSSLENDIEKCTQEIDNILYNNALENNQYIDKIVAHYLKEYGHDEWIYNDDVSGPELNEISQAALMLIIKNDIIYDHKFKIICEEWDGIKYFKAKLVEEYKGLIKYNEIRDEIAVLNKISDKNTGLVGEIYLKEKMN